MIFRSLDQFVRQGLPKQLPGNASEAVAGVALTIGNFDGCHLGHRALIQRSMEQARVRNLATAVLTFDPHPEVFFGRLPTSRLLFTLEQRVAAIAGLGVAGVIVQTFDQDFACRSAQDFALGLLGTSPAVRLITVGSNFHFGAKRSGNVGRLREWLTGRGVDVDVADLCDSTGQPISSSRIRDMLAAGAVSEGAALLGAPHAIRGIVERGDQLGATIGFPTANLGQIGQLIPGSGVYAVVVLQVDGEKGEVLGQGVCNIGTRPTVGGTSLRVEAHILDRHPGAGVGESKDRTGLDLYGKQLELRFVARIREEQKFPSLDELKKQIARDVDAARSCFEGLSG